MSALFFSIPLLGIIYEDFKFRAIHWYWLLLVLAFGFLHFGFHGKQSLINLVLLGFQYAFISFYFSVKEKRIVNIVDKYLGLGDILFLLPLALFFSPANFLLFLILSLIGTLCAVVITRIINKSNYSTIPLAGFQSIFLMIIIWMGWLNDYDFRWDSLF